MSGNCRSLFRRFAPGASPRAGRLSKTPCGRSSTRKSSCTTIELEPPMNYFDRRSFVKMGAVQFFGLLGYGDVLRLRAQSPAPAKRDISIIHLWLTGGLSQLDTFDPKPDIDSRYRSLFKPIETNVSGIRV